MQLQFDPAAALHRLESSPWYPWDFVNEWSVAHLLGVSLEELRSARSEGVAPPAWSPEELWLGYSCHHYYALLLETNLREMLGEDVENTPDPLTRWVCRYYGMHWSQLEDDYHLICLWRDALDAEGIEVPYMSKGYGFLGTQSHTVEECRQLALATSIR